MSLVGRPSALLVQLLTAPSSHHYLSIAPTVDEKDNVGQKQRLPADKKSAKGGGDVGVGSGGKNGGGNEVGGSGAQLAVADVGLHAEALLAGEDER